MGFQQVFGVKTLIGSDHFVEVVLLLEPCFGLGVLLLQSLDQILLHLDTLDGIIVLVIFDSCLLRIGIFLFLECQNLILQLRRLAIIARKLVL